MYEWTEFEAFGGILAWHKALERVSERHGDTCRLKGYWEIDKFASNSAAAIHGVSEELNMWDITKPNKNLSYSDLFLYSPSCVTYSLAGKNKGSTVDQGNLFWNALEKIKIIKPKFAVMENVPNLVHKHIKDFKRMLNDLKAAGYHNYWKILNTNDYDIPQNRKRVFIVSIRQDLYDAGKRFEFPSPIKRTKNLFDMLEKDVDEKYFISEEMLNSFLYDEKEFRGQIKFKSEDDDAFAITCKEGQRITCNYIKISVPNSTGYQVAHKGDAIRLNYPDSENQRGRVGYETAMTIPTGDFIGVYDGERVRKLTPLECFRLQGFDDIDYYKAVDAYDKTFIKGKSDTQMYKRAGNTITVNVIEEIFENLLYDRKTEGSQISLF